MGILNIDDTLTLQTVKNHLQVEHDDDDSIIGMYMSSSLSHVTNYTGHTFEKYSCDELFYTWGEKLYLEWTTPVKKAVIKYYTDDSEEISVNVEVLENNIIISTIPDDYNGGSIVVEYITFVEELQVPISHQIRLLIIGDWYSFRENTVAGTQISEVNNSGVKIMLDSIKSGRI